MKWYIVVLLFAVALAEELELADICSEEVCKLPDCRCSSTNIPGGLQARDTPQLVTLTFDDGLNILNIETYRRILYGRQNSNGCPIGTTFYVNHEYTNYQFANELYNRGFEIGLHSISHQTPQTYWAEANYDDMKEQFGDQRLQMSHFANIPIDQIQGIRSPFLQLAGNNTFQVIKDSGLTYDCSWPTISSTNPGLWPYTLDYASTQDCPIPPCPSASLPGVWVQPMVSWIDLNGVACSMVDGCFWIPEQDDADAWYNFILTNFERHYLNNRAPFGFYVHEWYIAAHPAVSEALVRFLDLIGNLDDAFLVNSADVLEWVKNPIPLPEYKKKPCRSFVQTTCPATTCPAVAEHNNLEYWMAVCSTCPRVYPWLGNPLGQ